jgi:hypothetical protein
MQVQVTDFAKDRIIYQVSNATREELDNRLHLFFGSEGYKPKTVTGEKWVFEKGNRVLRILFGAFVKYHKQSISIVPQGDGFQLLLHRDSSGLSGGLIGMHQVRKEFEGMTERFKAYMNQ